MHSSSKRIHVGPNPTKANNMEKESFGDKLIEDLTEFVETLEKGKPISDKFVCKILSLDKDGNLIVHESKEDK